MVDLVAQADGGVITWRIGRREGERFARRLVLTPVGAVLVSASTRGVSGCVFLDAEAERCGAGSCDGPEAAVGHAERAERQLREYFSGVRRGFDVPLDLRGTAFQIEAWRGLCEIPYAGVVSYAEQARRLGRPKAVRAVGAANGANKIAILIPCHRVVASDGTLHGYGGGLDRKRWLIEHELKHAGVGLF
jgi:AraC family transcriptional regulator of adaptative response/methylated-DNA-[protein]-cysteine methyltransferase